MRIYKPTKKAVRALDQVATWLEAGAPHEKAHGMKFDMNFLVQFPTTEDIDVEAITTKNWCGTACCIAGALVTFSAAEFMATQIKWGIKYNHLDNNFRSGYWIEGGWDKACEILDISDVMALQLFEPWDTHTTKFWPAADAITPPWAARTIRHLIATGEVDWVKTQN